MLLLSQSYGNVTYRYVIVNSLQYIMHHVREWQVQWPILLDILTICLLSWVAFHVQSPLKPSFGIIWDFKQMTMAGTDMAARSNLPPKIMRQCACTVRWLHTAVSMKSDYMSRDVLLQWLLHQVYFVALFSRNFGILRTPLDTISFKINLSQRLCQGCIS